jgi:predicted DNA-binding protein (UPF0251 family)
VELDAAGIRNRQSSRISCGINEALTIKLEDYTEISIAEAAGQLHLETEKFGRADQNRIAASLKGLGFVREGKFTQGAHRNSARYIRKS